MNDCVGVNFPACKVTRCDHGHEFVVMENHPRTGEILDCPHCMKIQIIQFEAYIDTLG